MLQRKETNTFVYASLDMVERIVVNNLMNVSQIPARTKQNVSTLQMDFTVFVQWVMLVSCFISIR